MPSEDRKISLLLTGSVDNRSLPELVAPLVQQGEAPKLIESTNTRLSKVPGTCSRSPKFTQVATFAAGTEKWGVIPSANARVSILPGGASSAAYYTTGHEDETSDGSGTDSGETQNAYVPTRITSAGGLDGLPVDAYPAISVNAVSGIEWRAFSFVNTTKFLYVSAYNEDGQQIVAPAYAGASAFALLAHAWFGLTSHGSFGDYIWYAEPGGISFSQVVLSGRTFAPFPRGVAAVPGNLTAGIDVVSDGGGFAYLAHSQTGSSTGATLRRIDVTSGTTTHSVNIAGALSGGGKCAVHYGTIGGQQYVLVAFSRASGERTTIALYTATLTPVGAPFEVPLYGDVSCAFYECGRLGRMAAVVFVSVPRGDFSANPTRTYLSDGTFSPDGSMYVGTRCYEVPLASWGTTSSLDFQWLTLVSHCVTWDHPSGSGHFPIVFLGRSYGDVAATPGGANYVDDPSAVAYLYSDSNPMAIARVGTVRGTTAPANTTIQPVLVSRSFVIDGDLARFAYQKLPRSFSGEVTATCRFAQLDLSAHQPPIAYDKSGAAMLALALPVQFDGDFNPLSGPLFTPKIAFVEGASGPTIDLPDGVYSFVACYEWADNAGDLHRSRISNIITRTNPGPKFAVAVTKPDKMATGSAHVALYMTEANETSFHLYGQVMVEDQLPYTQFYMTAVVDGAAPEIYSTGGDGEEILPQPAPPLRDVVTIGPRAWGIDAEVPTRVVYSKLRVAGVGYEFAPALEINLPSDAGDAFAIREWQGLVIVLAERGVYQISGDGPSNNGTGGDFSQPIRISLIGCANTASVVAFPGGVIWQSGKYFAMLSGSGLDYVPNFGCTYDVTLAFVLQLYDEVLFFSDQLAEVRVYNYSVGRWTTWDQATLPGPVTCGALLPYNLDSALLYAPSVPGGHAALYRLDADSVSDAASMIWETDWMLLGGDFQDHVLIRDVIFNGTIGSDHALTVELWMDYETSASRVGSWSAATLAAIATGGRYTVRLEPKEINGRAVKVRIYDTVAPETVDRTGLVPRSLTLVYAIDGQLFETVFVEGSRQ